MSRVEPKEQAPNRELKDDRYASKAEGDEKSVDQTLKREEEKRPED